MIYAAVMFLPATAVAIFVMFCMVGRKVFGDKAKGIEHKTTGQNVEW